jgi:uncharacterized lipoprotein YajG
MKRLAVVVAVLAIAACKAKDSAPADTSVVAAPAMSPAMGDSMKHDSSMSTTTTTTKTDSTMMKKDSTMMKKKP